MVRCHNGLVYSEDSVAERKRMRGAKCPVPIEYMDLKTSNRGTAAEWFDV